MAAPCPAVAYFRRPSLPAGLRYALLLRPQDRPGAKPLAFADAGGLARHLHRARAGMPLQLQDAELRVRQDDKPRAGVSVWTLDPASGDRARFLGWAYLGGAGRHSLQAALQAEDMEDAA